MTMLTIAPHLDKYTLFTSSLIASPTQINHTVFCLQFPSPHPIKSIEMLRDTGDGKQDTLQKLRQQHNTKTTRSLIQNINSSSASILTNRHQGIELLSFLLHQRAIIYSQRISLSFWPASWERGWKCGCFWTCAVCVSICLLVINGGSSNICSFSCWHMTHSQSFLAWTRHKFWRPSFLAARLMWLRNAFRHFNTSKKQVIVFINSCRRDAPTQADSKGPKNGACVSIV